MSSVNDLPKIDNSLKEGILGQHKLKETQTSEKVSLPTAEDVKAEKTHQGLMEGVEGFTPEKLHHVKTREPASGAEGENLLHFERVSSPFSAVLKTEMAHQSSVKEVSSFEKDKLKKVETNEKNPLPDKDGKMKLIRRVREVNLRGNLQPFKRRRSTTSSRRASRRSSASR